jgi:hypothetical protein
MKTASPARLLFCASVALAFSAVRAGSEPCLPAPTVRELARMSPCELDRLFAAGHVGCLPVGKGHGRVLYVCDAKRPRMRAAMQSAVWKGKEFFPGGEFINLWCGFSADRSHADIGVSWFDGQPAIVMEYPPSSPMFHNNRDELREIAPGLFLARYYDRCPCPKLKGYFVLQFTGCGD